MHFTIYSNFKRVFSLKLTLLIPFYEKKIKSNVSNYLKINFIQKEKKFVLNNIYEITQF
jgi:hypothetical protein